VGFLGFRKSLLSTPDERKVHGIPMVRGRIVRIELDGSLKLPLGAEPVPIEPLQKLSQRVVCLSEFII